MRDGKVRWHGGLGLALLLFAVMAGPASATVRYVSTGGFDLPNDCATPATPCRTVNHAIAVASPGDTVKVGPGDFTITHGPTVNMPLTLEGAQAGVDARGRNLPPAQETFLEAGEGAPVKITSGAGTGGHVVVDGFRIVPALNEPYGIEIQAAAGGGHVFRNNIFSGAPEVAAVGGPLAGVTFERNVVSANKAGLKASGAADGAVVRDNYFAGTTEADLSFAEGGAGILIEGNERRAGSGAFAELAHTSGAEVLGNTVEATAGPAALLAGSTTGTLVSGNRFAEIASPALLMTTSAGAIEPNEDLTVTGNTFLEDTAAVQASGTGTLAGGALVKGNRIVGNANAVSNVSGTPIEAPDNWWGCNGGAGSSGCDTVSDEVNAEPHLVLTAFTAPSDIYTGQSSTVTTELAENSNGERFLGAGIPGTPFEFAAAQGSFSPVGGALDGAGLGTSTYTAGSAPGLPGATVKVDNQTVTAPLVVHPLLTSSQITAPADPLFAIWNWNEPNSIAVTGTTAGGTPGDTKVDIDCFTAGGVEVLASGVELAGDGSFSVPAVSLENAAAPGLCRLRAVTAGTVPADPTPFAGPLLAVGQRNLETYASGPAANEPYDFRALAQQLGAGGVYRSLGACGVQGFLDNAARERTTTTFECADRFWRFNDYGDIVGSTRSQIQIDGADAYTASSIDEKFGGIEGFPAISFSISQDPATGDTVIHDGETFDTCPTLVYPAIAANCLVSGGVRDERTIEQSEDGHLVTVTDTYSSLDGRAHAIDLLPENLQRFAGPGEENALAIGYRFPGEATYSTHLSGAVVPFPSDVPAAVRIRVEGAADGDQSTGQGAIVFDRPASPATFNLEDEVSGFAFHQTGTVPAAGSTSFRTAYVQGYANAEVEALVSKTIAAFTPPPVKPSTPSPTPAPGRPAAPARIELLKVTLGGRAGAATLLVGVSGPGRLKLSGEGIATTTAVSRKAGRVELAVRPSGTTRARLARRGKARVKLTVTFTPDGGGAPVRATREVVLRQASGRRPG